MKKQKFFDFYQKALVGPVCSACEAIGDKAFKTGT
jgi:hypothetical protein